MLTSQDGCERGVGHGHRAIAGRAGSRSRQALAGAFGCLLALALVPAAASALTAPSSDPFYTPPANLAKHPQGAILRKREVSMSGSQATLTAHAYQLMFRTTDATGHPAAAVTTVLVPVSPASGPRRLASYLMYYDSLTLNCAASYILQGGNYSPGTAGEDYSINQLLQQGWDVNVPDYEGLQSEWAVGPLLGRAALDSALAAEHLAAAGLDGARTEVSFNGYSGGSDAATWAAALAPSYAPSLDIVAVAAGGNFPDLDYTTQRFDGSVWYGTEIGILESFSRALPQNFDLSKLLSTSGQALAAKDGQDASGCAGSTTNEPYGDASQYTNFPDSETLADYPPVKRGLNKISLKTAPLPKAPLFLYNGVGDDLAYIQPVDALVADYCTHGVTVDYDRDPYGIEHAQAAANYWPAALQYLENAFAGDAPPDDCSTYSAVPATTG